MVLVKWASGEAQVRMGNHKRYQQWYMEKHLSGANADALITDLTRYLCLYQATPALMPRC